MIKHLVLSGGAFKGVSFIGVLECLQRKQILQMSLLETIAGSSVGAIISTLLAIGYNTAELFQIIVDLDTSNLVNIEIQKLVTHYGVDSGHTIMNKLQDLFVKKNITIDITFAQLYDITKKRLIITVTCLGEGVKYMDHLYAPDTPVLHALRMSFGIPLLFTAVRYQNKCYIDGGLLDNCPLSLFSKETPESVIIIRATYDAISEFPKDLETYLIMLLSTMLAEFDKLRAATARTLQNFCTITVCAEKMKTASAHSLSTTEKYNMFREGYIAAKQYLESDKWLTLKIHSLPYNAMRRVWQHKHKEIFRNVLKQITN